MKKYNIAIIGTFDCENFGDLMFPIIFKKQIEKRIPLGNLFLFSPNECEMPLNPQKTKIYSIDKLEEIYNKYGLDAIVFGGGDLVRLDNDFAPEENYVPINTSFDLMIYSAVVANKYNIPFVWNCPGTPFEFLDNEEKLIKTVLDNLVDYACVRDRRSAEILMHCGCEKEVLVSPDTVLSVSKLISKNEDGIFNILSNEFNFLKDGYVVFQSMINTSQEFKNKIKLQLSRISAETNKKIVFLPIGNVHNDDKYLVELINEYDNDSFVTFNRKLNIYEINAILANALAFIGTSLHGNIVSNSYGVPSIGINLLDLVKLKNYFILLGREKYCTNDIDGMASLFTEMMNNDTLNLLDNALNQIETHFDKICKMVHEGKKNTSTLHTIIKDCYMYKKEKKNKLTVYYNDGTGYSDRKKEDIRYYGNIKDLVFSLNVPDNVKTIRIDPVDNAGCIVTDLKIRSKGNDLSINTNAELCYDNSVLVFFNNDPQIEVNINDECEKIDVKLSLITASSNSEFGATLDKLTSSIFELKEKNIKLESHNNEYELRLNDKDDELQSIKAKYDELTYRYSQLEIQNAGISASYNEIQNSFFWRLTSPLRKISQFIKNIVTKNRTLLELAIYTKGFLRGGFKGGRRQLDNYLAISGGSKRLKLSVISKKIRKQQKRVKFSKKIKFSILVPLYNTPKNFLVEMIKSVQEQTYANWELCLVDGSTADFEYVERVCKKLAKKDKRIVYKKLEKNLGISENTNACISMSSGDYIALFDHDDVLHPSALFECMKKICDNDADYIYTDEATFLGNDITNIITFHYKPDFSQYNLLANNYICHFSVFSKKLIDKVGMFRNEYDGSQDHDIILRLTDAANNVVHIPKLLYFWRSHENSVAMDINSKAYAIKAGQNAVHDFLLSKGIESKVTSSPAFPTIYRIEYEIKDEPLVSIIIPNKNHFDDLFRCITSIKAKTTYPNYEIVVVDNGSTEEDVKQYYEKLKKDGRIKILSYDIPFNYSAINNYAVSKSNGEYLLLLNNDTEVITSTWIEELLMFAQKDDVGAVGAKLFYANNTVQHGGIILKLGADRIAGHSHYGVDASNLGYMGKMFYVQNISAVTAACLMVKKSKYIAVNGFDEEQAVAYNDVDFCLKLDELGLKNIFNPFCEMYHYESLSRGLDTDFENRERFLNEASRFRKKWSKKLEAGDPYYNPNFSLDESYAIK